MRVWVLAILLSIALSGCSRHRDYSEELRREDSLRQRFAGTQAAAYAAAAQVLLVDRIKAIAEREGAATLYVGYPDTLDPPDWFLRCSPSERVRLLPYSRMQNEETDAGVRMKILEEIALDTVRISYSRSIPMPQRLLWGGGGGDALLARAQGKWEIVQWRPYFVK